MKVQIALVKDYHLSKSRAVVFIGYCVLDWSGARLLSAFLINGVLVVMVCHDRRECNLVRHSTIRELISEIASCQGCHLADTVSNKRRISRFQYMSLTHHIV
ncbi:13085_t:CDS:1 [Acaulospora morrowiae]|uniref:13085_t:CDS:1 n=1 Tax=Acaulospora morrowiae TaxID=94023 RepID=A0A9N9BEX4_9GLOM|nr:13085_t:CDS:1 [Acaulospora morrowiae]